MIANAEGVTAYNRKGEPCGIGPTNIRQATILRDSVGSYSFDGEMIGEQYHVFELLELAGTDYTDEPYKQRKRVLRTLLQMTAEDLKSFVLGEVAWDLSSKRDMLKRKYEAGAEGLVFRNINAAYRTGRQPTEYKLKFWSSASFIVSEINGDGKNSVSLQLYDDKAGALVDVGHVTVDYRKKGVLVGSIIECKYLYFNEGGSVYQSSFLNKRDDIDLHECTMSQLRVKNAQVGRA